MKERIDARRRRMKKKKNKQTPCTVLVGRAREKKVTERKDVRRVNPQITIASVMKVTR